MQISEADPTRMPMALLLQADPSQAKVEDYLTRSKCFIARIDGVSVGVYVLQPIAADTYELMNIAVAPTHQRQGLGTRLLAHAIASAARLGARRLEVGTGTFGYQLAYYQRAGFRVDAIDRDFFLKHYPDPVYEDGIRHRDMLRLVLENPGERELDQGNP